MGKLYRLDDSRSAKLARLAHARNATEEEVLGMAVDQFADSPSHPQTAAQPAASLADAMRDAGLLAAFNGLPEDLSTDRRHFEGFGRD